MEDNNKNQMERQRSVEEVLEALEVSRARVAELEKEYNKLRDPFACALVKGEKHLIYETLPFIKNNHDNAKLIFCERVYVDRDHIPKLIAYLQQWYTTGSFKA